MATQQTTIPLVDLTAQHAELRLELEEAVRDVIARSGFIMGPTVQAFEEEFAGFCNAPRAVGVASGTAALHLALLACGVEPGDEVITSPHTFAATAEAIVHAGARPVFADIGDDYNLSAEEVDRALTERTRAIVPVHLYGLPADTEPLVELTRDRQLRVVEDAAQAHGATYRGRTVGTLGDAAAFSFYPGKNLGALGDAGAVTTADEEVADRVSMLRNHGRKGKYEHEVVGYGERLDALQAAALSVKLRHLGAWIARRQQIAAMYDEFLGEIPTIHVRRHGDDRTHAYHLYVIEVNDRERLQAGLRERGVATGVHYPLPLHLQPAFASLGHRAGDFPVAERAARRVVSLPMYPELSDRDVERVAQAVRDVALPAG